MADLAVSRRCPDGRYRGCDRMGCDALLAAEQQGRVNEFRSCGSWLAERAEEPGR